MMNKDKDKKQDGKARYGDASHEMFLFYSFCIGSG